MGFAGRITRRTLLRRSSEMTIGLAVSTLLAPPSPVATASPGFRCVWEQGAVPPGASPLMSPPLLADFPFNALESRWDADVPEGASLDFLVRASADGAAWGNWIPLHVDAHARDDFGAQVFGDLVIVPPATHAQYRIVPASGPDGATPSLRLFRLAAIGTAVAALPMLVRAATTGPTIVPRSGWGADENLRFEQKKGGSREERWAPEYRPIKKVIIHHTVTRDPEPDPQATIRAIYQYHAASREWGDIGYNFLIDQGGTIYEGRYGGDGVVGGHTLGYNYGSLGIAMLGTYSGHTISSAARVALAALIKAKAGDLDPLGKGFFIDRDGVPNIGGHRNLVETDCPGDGFYPYLNNVRRAVKNLPLWAGDPAGDPIAANPPVMPRRITTPVPVVKQAEPRATIDETTWSATSGYARDLLMVRLAIKNTGTVTIPAASPPPTLIYDEGDTYASKQFPSSSGAYRIAIGPTTAADDPPFRWGLPHALPPGETVTVTVAFRPRRPQRTSFVASLLREGWGTLDREDGEPITILPNPADPVPPDRNPRTPYFSETKHHVASEFHAYWEANGGVAQFGYPITEAFREANTDDGQTGLTQYCERAGLEVQAKPDGGDGTVQVKRLGAVAMRDRRDDAPFQRVPAERDSAIRRYFPAVGHTLAWPFKAYWDTHGGLVTLGLPLSEPFKEKSAADGQTYTVQYFERNWLEYHPDGNGAGTIVPGMVGTALLRRRGWLP